MSIDNGGGEQNTRVVYVDDNIEAAGVFEDAFRNFTAVDLREPEWRDKLEKALDGAELIITDWDLADMKKDPFFPADGKALNEVLRAKWRNNPANPLYTIFSGRLDSIPNAEHHAGRPHILAQDLDVEWVGSKDKANAFKKQLMLLCAAREQLRGHPLAETNVSDYWRNLFALSPESTWVEAALEDIDRNQPPVQHLYGVSRDERVFLRWLTRMVLPYPTFLLDSYEVALRLKLEPESTAVLLSDQSSELSRGLIAVRYEGVLSGFMGERWWRAGVADWIWRATDGNPFEPNRLREALTAIGGGKVRPLEQRDPVLLRDERGRPTQEDLVADATDAVRFQPDEWPASAPWPWTRISTVLKDPIMRAIVLPDDQHVLKGRS
jgi:hypothetical protein